MNGTPGEESSCALRQDEEATVSLSPESEENEEDSILSYEPRKYIPSREGVEDYERYTQGGYHPTQIGDSFDNNRFNAVHKLGFGSLSTVWLASDTSKMKFVALKILIADESTDCREEQILAFLQSKGRPDQPGSIHIPHILHKFRFDGSNGSHLCLVLPLIGPSVSEYLYARLDAGLPLFLPKDIALHFSRQIVSAVAYLHTCGVCHGGNVLLLPHHDSSL